jgi:hypothetical protein
MPDPIVFRRFDSFHGPQVIGDHWTASKDGRTMRCQLSTHPLGKSLRLTVDSTFMRSQVCKTQDESFRCG